MIVTVEGVSIFASDGGVAFDAAKPSVVMVHGVGMDHTFWGQQTRYLAHHGFNVLAIDLPGHGKSGGDALTTVEEMAGFLNSFIEAAGAGPAIVAGHSMGSLIALEAAAQRPVLTRALALCGVSSKMGVHPDLLQAAEENRILAPELMSAWGHGPRAHKGGNIASGIWLTGGAIRLLERAKPGLIASGLKACVAYKGAVTAAEGIAQPVLILGGRYDKMTPMKTSAPLSAVLEDSRTVTLEQAGHMMMLEDPGGARSTLYDFCKSVAA